MDQPQGPGIYWTFPGEHGHVLWALQANSREDPNPFPQDSPQPSWPCADCKALFSSARRDAEKDSLD